MSLDLLWDWLCHRAPERAHLGGGVDLVLCARCTGIYLGALCSVFGVLVALRVRPSGGRSRVPLGLLLLAGGTPLEVVLEQAGLVAGTNELRFALGAVTGASLALLLGVNLFRREGGPTLPTAVVLLPAGLLLALGAAVALSAPPTGWSGPVLAGFSLLVGLAALTAGRALMGCRPGRKRLQRALVSGWQE